MHLKPPYLRDYVTASKDQVRMNIDYCYKLVSNTKPEGNQTVGDESRKAVGERNGMVHDCWTENRPIQNPAMQKKLQCKRN